jgi:hypothetical protein
MICLLLAISMFLAVLCQEMKVLLLIVKIL